MRKRHALLEKWLFLHSSRSSISNLLAIEHVFILFVGWLQHNWVTDLFLGGVYIKVGFRGWLFVAWTYFLDVYHYLTDTPWR